MIEINKIYQGDCLEVMKKIDDNFIDLIIADPPYGIKIEKWDIFSTEWIEECYRILKPTGNICVFAGWSNVSKLKDVLLKYFKERNWIIWDRIKGRGAKYNFISTREDILWFSKSENYIFNKQSSTIKKKTGGMGKKNGDEFRKLSNVWTDISPIVPWSKERVVHPTQKPLMLMERMIKIFSNENDIVLDLFSGSGSTSLASKLLNRKYIGIEKNKEYIEIIKKRLKY